MKLDIVEDLVNNLEDDNFKLDISSLQVDYDNIEGEIAVFPLLCMRISIFKADKEHELSMLEKELEHLYYSLCKEVRSKKTHLPNEKGASCFIYPTNNAQVQERVYTSTEYQEMVFKVEKKKKEINIVRSYYSSFLKKYEIYKRYSQKDL